MRKADYIIRINNFEHPEMEGSIEKVVSGRGFRFQSLVEMMVLLEQDMNKMGFPAPQYDFRRWLGRGSGTSIHNFDMHRDEDVAELQALLSSTDTLANFWISVRFRQWADWQGELVWMDRALAVYFRSFMELVHLMQDAVFDSYRIRECNDDESSVHTNHQTVI